MKKINVKKHENKGKPTHQEENEKDTTIKELEERIARLEELLDSALGEQVGKPNENKPIATPPGSGKPNQEKKNK